MYLEDENTKSDWQTIRSKCDECGEEYNAKIKTAKRQVIEVGHQQCRRCSSRRAGKKTAKKMSKIYSELYSGDGNWAKREEVRNKISESKKGKKLSNSHKQALRKKKGSKEKIIEAANRPEELKRRSDYMTKNNPMFNFESRNKMQSSILDLYDKGHYDNPGKFYKRGWVCNTKTLSIS